jgi:hypothetical protein
MIRKDYTFNPATTPATILFVQPIDLSRFGAIFNVTKGQVIYNPSDPTMLGTVSGQVLSLSYAPTAASVALSSMSATDVLQVFYSGDNYPVLSVEQATFEGSTNQELLGQVLIELRVLNHQIYDMNSGRSTGREDPDSIRHEILTNF